MSEPEPHPFEERVNVGDSGMAFIYSGVETGDRLELMSVTVVLPQNAMGPGDAPTLRKISALLRSLPDAARTGEPEARARMDEIERRTRPLVRSEDEPLTPPRDGLTDEFLLRVAQSYSDHALRTHKPNKAISDETNVPVGTVRRWVVEARRRGLLPPGERGRAT